MKEKRKRKKKKKKRTRETEAIRQAGFLQLICKASLTFKSNLELALSIILKQRELYESNYVAVECRCLSFLIFFLKSSLKMTSFTNIARTTASTSKFIYQERFQIIRNCLLYRKNNI